MSIQISRRAAMRGIVSSTVSLALAPSILAQHGPPPGKIALRFNENPYGPSASGLKAAAEALEMGAYYPSAIPGELIKSIPTKN